MSAAPISSPLPKRRRISRKAYGLRSKRILQRLREGRSHQTIADEEGLTLRRVREVIKKALPETGDDPGVRRAVAEIARLAPVIALAEAKIAEGDLIAARILIAVQKRVDFYCEKTAAIDALSAEDQSVVDKVTRLMLHANPHIVKDKEFATTRDNVGREENRPNEEASL